MSDKIPYICGPLTELPEKEQEAVKVFYSRIADICESAIGKRAFVPHEHFDPIKHPDFSPSEVDATERRQVCELTSVLVVVAIAPSWGGGIEVEMANRSGVPVVVLHKKDKKVSRLLRGNPAVREIIIYEDEKEALNILENKLKDLIK